MFYLFILLTSCLRKQLQFCLILHSSDCSFLSQNLLDISQLESWNAEKSPLKLDRWQPSDIWNSSWRLRNTRESILSNTQLWLTNEELSGYHPHLRCPCVGTPRRMSVLGVLTWMGAVWHLCPAMPALAENPNLCFSNSPSHVCEEKS